VSGYLKGDTTIPIVGGPVPTENDQFVAFTILGGHCCWDFCDGLYEELKNTKGQLFI